MNYHNCNDNKYILKNIANNLSKKDGIVCKLFNKEEHIKKSKKRKKIKLGICSKFFFSHSITYIYKDLIKDLVDSGVEVIIFRGQNDKVDSITNYIESIVSKTILLPQSLEGSCKLILKEFLDILFYLDIGADAQTYLMSLSRLALVQVIGFGYMQSSGSNNIDYYISSKHLESKKTKDYFSERLIRFTRFPINLSIPKVKSIPFKRSNLNISNNAFLIGLPHSIFKFHPDFDFIIEKIIEEIPNALLFIFEGHMKYEIDQLKERWSRNKNLILERTIIHQRVSFEKYISIIKCFDIILDPFYSGMGVTAYQAMALAIPIVSMPNDFMQSRVVNALYKQMEIKNPPLVNTPEEYISMCKELASNSYYKNDISKQIRYKYKKKLFNDKDIFKQYNDFFQQALYAARKGDMLPSTWNPN